MIDSEISIMLENYPGNFMERIYNLEMAVQELQISETPGIEELQRDDVRVIDLDLFPAAGVTVTDPTSTDYIGGFISGEGLTFGANTWNFGGVNAGVIQVGINTVDGTLYAINANIAGIITIGAGSTAGGWVIDSSSIHDAASFVGLSSAVTGGNDLRIWAGSATPASGSFRVYEDGSMVSSKGTIGGWTISALNITDTAGLVGMSSAVTGSDDIRFWAGNVTPSSAAFRVTEAGALFATSAVISGSITATSGTVGGFTIGANTIQDTAGLMGMSSAVTGGNDIRFWAGNATPASAPFIVFENGALTASAITIAGTSSIAGWNIDSTRVYKLSSNVGIILDSSIPAIKIGDTAGTYILLDGANQRIRSSNYSAGTIGSNWDTATGNAEFNNITVRGALAVTTIQYGYVTARSGTEWIVPATGVLRDDCTSVNSPTTFAVNVKDPDGMTHAAAGAQWTVGDIIRLKEPLTGDLWASISSKTDNTTYWTLNVVKQSPGAGTNYTFRAGLAIIDYGVSGSGFISLSADTQMGAAPNITLGTHAGSPWTTTSNQVRIGNLNGSYGYVSAVYGVGMGQYGSAGQPSLTIDTTNGIRIISNITTIGQWDTSGNVVVGQVAASQSNVLISSGAVSIRNNTTVLASWGSTGVITIGQVGASQNNVLISSGAVSIRNNTTERIGMTAAGVLTIKDSGGNAVFTFDASTGAELTKKLTLSGVSSAIAIGATPPTANNSGTGIWIDNVGVYSVSAGTQNATLTSAGLSAGASAVVLNSTGISISTGGSANNKVKWQTSGVEVAFLLTQDTSGTITTSLQTIPNATSTNSIISIGAYNNSGTNSSRILLESYSAVQSKISINVDTTDSDTVINGTSANLFYADAGNNRIGILKSNPTTTLDVVGTVAISSTLTVTGAATFNGAVNLGDAAADTITFTGTPAGLVVGATYTPTLTNVTNIASSTALSSQYSRIGAVVTVSGSITIDPTATGAAEVGVSFPIASSPTGGTNCAGVFCDHTTASNVGRITADTVNNRARFLINAVDAASRTYSFIFQYLIV